jgi:hypothetical protein
MLAVGLLFAAQAKADEAAQAIIDKAIQAAGGAENLTKFKAAHWKGKGKFYGFGDAIEYTGEWHQQFPGQMKVVIDVDFGGMKIQNVRVINRDKAWSIAMGVLQELGQEEMAEANESLHYDRAVWFVPLKGKDFQLTSLGESLVDKKPAVGVKVACKGRRDFQLYFDKESALLVKGVMRVKDQMSGGEEVSQEIFYAGHKEMQGRMVPTRAIIHREGKLYIEAEVTDYRRLDQIDDKVFGKPE